MGSKCLYFVAFVISATLSTVSADEAIAQGLARVALLTQGYDVDFLSPPEGEIVNQEKDLYPETGFEFVPEVTTTSGPVLGALYPQSYAFYSIPFAQPPIRYQPPVPIAEPLPCINASVTDMLVCQQLQKNCSNGVCIHNTNEDCLVLNVHTPSSVSFEDGKATTSIRSVLVWFHGGGFFGGGATVPEFEARWFANQTNTVIVTANYRLGAFGFLVHGEGEDAIKGNQGLKDQQLALQWVNDNIANFGGDPNKITIFGNSAGAQSVMFHLVSEVSRPLFQRGIMESNPAVFYYQTPEEAKNVTRRLLRALNCTATTTEGERECLMEADPKAINIALIAVMPMSLIEDGDLWSTVEAFRPVIDGVEFKQQPFEMFRDGTWQTEKDLIVGTNIEELEMIQYYVPDQTPEGKPIPFKPIYEAINRFLFGNETGQMIMDKYIETAQRPIDYEQLLGVEASHMFFICPSRLMARFASNTATTGRVYLYSNSHPMDGPTCLNVVNPPEMCGMSFHGSEPPFVFRSGPFYGYDFRDADVAVANQFNYYWANFAASGDPSTVSNEASHSLGPFESWPQYVQSSPSLKRSGAHHLGFGNLLQRIMSDQVFAETSANSWQNIMIDATANGPQEGYMEDMCDFWDSLNYYVDLNPSGDNPTTTSSTATPASTTTASSNSVSTTGPDLEFPESTTCGTARLQLNILYTLISALMAAIYAL